MIKLMLNLHKFNNYAFFCPVSRLHLTVSSPVGFANEVTPAIFKALKAETVLDVDGVVDIETGTVKASQQTTAPAQQPVQDAKDNAANKVEEVKADEVKVDEAKNDEVKAEEIKANDEVKVEETKTEEVKADDTNAEEKPKRGGKKAAKADAE